MHPLKPLRNVVTRDDVTLSSYRNLWQLTAKQQAGLRVLLEWHNRFGGQRGSPHWKTLFNIAAAEPKDVDTLSDIKGVSRSWSRTDGAKLITQMAEAMSCIDDSVEVPTSQPSPYATFDQHYREAWPRRRTRRHLRDRAYRSGAGVSRLAHEAPSRGCSRRQQPNPARR